MDALTRQLDQLDRDLITALRKNPRASLTKLAQRLRIARGTLYSRLDRLEREQVITGYGPDVDPAAAGYGVVAFTTLEIAQGSHTKTLKELNKIAEILEVHTVTGEGDLLLRVIAQSNDHLHTILQQVSAIPSVGRSQTQLALATKVNRSVADVVGLG